MVEQLPPVTLGGNWVKHCLRVLPIAVAFSILAYGISTEKSDKLLKGTWKVEKLTRNGRVVPPTAWLTDTTAWNRVYFSGWEGCVFSPNPYRYRPKESWRGNYEFDSTKNNLRLMMYPSDAAKVPDTLLATLSQRTTKAMRLRGIWQGDTIDMQLARLR